VARVPIFEHFLRPENLHMKMTKQVETQSLQSLIFVSTPTRNRSFHFSRFDKNVGQMAPKGLKKGLLVRGGRAQQITTIPEILKMGPRASKMSPRSFFEVKMQAEVRSEVARWRIMRAAHWIYIYIYT